MISKERPDSSRHRSSEGRTVFVVGAGFSTEFGYPMARDLLPRLWGRLEEPKRKAFSKVFKFHHPDWDFRPATLPEIEILLTELAASDRLLPSGKWEGPFTVRKLRKIREELLFEIANWFHEIHTDAPTGSVTSEFVDRVRSERATVISFNWDYELDKALFPKITPKYYGLGKEAIKEPVLLKPHGSLNWYPEATGRKIKSDRRVKLWNGKGRDESIYCFLRWRAPRSHRRRYVPWIVPPTHLKDFQHGMLKRIWERCVEALSTAKKVYFLGYSLPVADWHSRYIFRCGFHNQEKRVPLRGRHRAPGSKAKVWVVNPDPYAFRRIESIVGWDCEWVPTRVGNWLDEDY